MDKSEQAAGSSQPPVELSAGAGGHRKLNADGSLDISAFVLPFSAYTSAEARIDMQQKFDRLAEIRAGKLPPEYDALNPIERQRVLSDRILFMPWLESQRRRYEVEMKESEIAGVEVQIFEPKAGISPKNRDRVLIELHGGGFVLGWGSASQIESIPICALGRIKVVSINYRMFPEGVFPAASEDVAAVYRELLKTNKPSQIGIYGGSAGGILTAESMAWFQKEGLPLPAAICLWSAPSDPHVFGDSAFITPEFGSYMPAPTSDRMQAPYFPNGIDLNDPLVAPSASNEVLSNFPPTLIATGTRAGDMSAAANTHLKLLEAGVDARFLLWDGLDHCFMYNPEMPESRQAYAMTVKFFAEVMDRVERQS